MSLLTIVQTVYGRLGLPKPSSVIGNTEPLVVQMRGLLEEGGAEVRDTYRWPQLNRETTITLVDGTADYSLPADLDYRIAQTEWDRSNHWPLIGPVTPEEWQAYKSGVQVSPTRTVFRVKGFGPAKVSIYPTPTAAEDGNILAYEYQSLYWIRTSAGTEGSLSLFAADTDVSLLREDLMAKELYWRWRRAKLFAYEELEEEARMAWEREIVALKGTRTINRICRRGWKPPYPNVPETGYGS